MYTIKQAAARVGVSVDLLRAWERRYGIVEPERTPAGYRLYDDAAVARLGAMRRLVEAGWSPATAAATLLDPAQPPVAAAAIAPEPPGRPDDSGAREAERFVAAASALDQGAVASVLDDMFAGRSLERALSDEVYPALRSLGTAWSRGAVSVAGEHLASHAVLRRLAAAFEAAAHRSDGPVVAVGLPPGSRHELGVLGFATVARRNGLRVSYLGPDLPIEDWLSGTDGAAAAVIGVPTMADRAPAATVVERLAADRPELVVAIGGSAAGSLGTGAIELPDDVEAAIDRLRQEVATAGPG
jgi:DNA-binding transcriptional MerR regulator